MNYKTKIIEVKQVHESYWQIKVEMPNDYTWIPGQFARFTLEEKIFKDEKNFRMFSIASVMDEGFILIGTKALPGKISEFKKALFSMKQGEIINISSAMGKFIAQDDQNNIQMYASGIGITPIRALLKGLIKPVKQQVNVIYASYDYYMFEDELEKLAHEYDNIEFIKTIEIDETMDALKIQALKYGNNSYYYISGAPFVVKAVRQLYKELNIDDSCLIDDVFIGY